MNHIKSCTRCRLHKYRKHVILGRGTIPAKILFIGEAPGKTEDLLGEAFVGPSGKLLEKMLNRAASISAIDMPSYYITNTILCRPTDARTGPNRTPEFDEILSCAGNLLEIVGHVHPEIIVFIGKVAAQNYADEFPGAISIQHPAFLLRDGGEASPYYLQNVRTLAMMLKNA